jgi:hypothetical protein
MPKNEGPETLLLDLSTAAVKELIRNAKKRGYATHDQINALPLAFHMDGIADQFGLSRAGQPVQMQAAVVVAVLCDPAE